jgi:hypothetical protein
MRRYLTYLKATMLSAMLIGVLGVYPFKTSAQDPLDPLAHEGGGSVCLASSCDMSSTNQCYCPTGLLACRGCFIANGESRCGFCSSR